MKKFILKVVLILAPTIAINLTFGILRNHNGDETIPFRQNWMDQYMNLNQMDPAIGLMTIDAKKFDMSKDVLSYTLTRFKDKWGFQNAKDIKSPNILFIGDSFFDDPFLSYTDGLSYNFNSSMNLSSVGCSGFKVFNELKDHGYFTTLPKIIFMEVVERNFSAWSDLFEQIETNEFKTKPYYYCGLDFVFGNNITGASMDNLKPKKKTIDEKRGTIHVLDGKREIYFYTNQIQTFDDETLLDKTFKNMKLVSDYFKQKNTQVVFIIAPDKESIYPEFYPASNLPKIHKQMDALQLNYINMYETMMQSPIRTNCYWDGDTHWNPNAYKMLIDQMRAKTTSLGIK